MKPASPLTLLLFLQFATAVPTPILHPNDCENYLQCQSSLQIRKPPATPSTRLLNPHFPDHQLQSLDSDDVDEPFDNASSTPPEHTNPTTALSAETPLTSAYLLSLNNDLGEEQESEEQPSGIDALPAKPTSALPYLRKLDSIRYWADLIPSPDPNPNPTPILQFSWRGYQIKRVRSRACLRGSFLASEMYGVVAEKVNR